MPSTRPASRFRIISVLCLAATVAALLINSAVFGADSSRFAFLDPSGSAPVASEESSVGAGTLLILNFNVIGTPGQSTTLVFADYTDPGNNFHPGFVFNEGDPVAMTTNGSVTIPGGATGTPANTATVAPTATFTPTATN